MDLTIRHIPETLDVAIRQRARAEGKEPEAIILQTLQEAFGLPGRPFRRRYLGDLAGQWVEDPETDRALEEQRRIDDER